MSWQHEEHTLDLLTVLLDLIPISHHQHKNAACCSFWTVEMLSSSISCFSVQHNMMEELLTEASVSNRVYETFDSTGVSSFRERPPEIQVVKRSSSTRFSQICGCCWTVLAKVSGSEGCSQSRIWLRSH